MESQIYDELFLLEKNYWWHVSKRNLVHKEIKRAGIKSPMTRILDAGCGTGIMMSELAKKFPLTYGIDNSKKALKFCHKRGLHKVKLGDLEKKLPFPTNHFDVITCLDVIEHLKHDGAALKEMHRVLKKDGRIFINVPAFQFLWTHHDDLLWHKRRYRRRELVKLIRKSGFRVQKSSYFYSFLFLQAVVLFKLGLLFGGKKTSVIPPKPINYLLLSLCFLEQKIIKFLPLPFGLSVFLVATKV